MYTCFKTFTKIANNFLFIFYILKSFKTLGYFTWLISQIYVVLCLFVVYLRCICEILSTCMYFYCPTVQRH